MCTACEWPGRNRVACRSSDPPLAERLPAETSAQRNHPARTRLPAGRQHARAGPVRSVGVQSGRAPSPGSSSCQRRAPGSMLAPRPTRPAPWHLGDGRRARGEATPDGACHCHSGCQHLAEPASVHEVSASSRARVFHPSAEVGCRQVARRTGAELPRPTCVVQMILARWTAHFAHG